MQIKQFMLFVLSLALLEVTSLASDLKDKMSFGINTYNDNADVQVYSPTFALYKKLSSQWLLGVKMRIDAVTAASIKNGSNATHVDAVTAASAKESVADDVRYAPTAMLTYDDGDNLVTFGSYYSTENDYTGVAAFASYVRQLNQQNTALGVSASQSFDKWSPVFKRALPKDNRNETKIDFSANQLITPEFSMSAVYSYMYSEGFLSSPYHFILQDSLAKFENYPDKRTGHAFALKGVYLLDKDDSVNFSYRYYMDDWDIKSHTSSVEFMRDFTHDFTSGLRLRYYTQTGSNFVKPVGTYGVSDQYFAVDYRMSAFDSYTIGVPFIYRMKGGDKLTASIDYYKTSSNEYLKNWYDVGSLQSVFTTLTYEFAY